MNMSHIYLVTYIKPKETDEWAFLDKETMWNWIKRFEKRHDLKVSCVEGDTDWGRTTTTYSDDSVLVTKMISVIS